MTALNGGLPQIGSRHRLQQVGANDWLPSKEYNNVWDFIQNVAINKGAHALKFGAEYRIIKFPFFQVPYPHGEMNFSQQRDRVPVDGDGALEHASRPATRWLRCCSAQSTAGRSRPTTSSRREKIGWAFYAQDDWKVTPKLTLNLGVRYELFSPIGEKFGRQSNFVYDNLTLYIPKGKDQDAPLPPNFATAFPYVKVSRGEVDKYLIPWDKYGLRSAHRHRLQLASTRP